jgi:hypothetical protein
MKKIFLICFLFLIQSIYNLSIQDFLESLFSTLLKQNVDLEDCINDDFINSFELITSGLNEKNNKKFTLGFISAVKGAGICALPLLTYLTLVEDMFKECDTDIGNIDFEKAGVILSNLINSFFDESGNYITYGEALGNAFLQIIAMLKK